MAKHYPLVIGCFSLLMAMQLVSAFSLFGLKLGWTPESIQLFYLGNPDIFVVGRSRIGLIETAVPHLAALSVTAFILAHFLLFVPQVSTKRKTLLGMSFLLSGLADTTCGFLIIYFGSIFVYIKYAAFIIFQVSYLFILWILLKATIQKIWVQRKTSSLTN